METKENNMTSLITNSIPKNVKVPFNWAIFFEWGKLIQRVVMIILTIALVLVMRTASYEIRDMRTELAKLNIQIDVLKTKADEIQKEVQKGIKLRFW